MAKGHILSFLFCLLSIFLIYANSFNASWHLDDYQNIIQNQKIHIQNVSPKSLKGTFFASSDRGFFTETSLYRPIPMLSFALNWYFGKAHVWGYHLVNTLIHCFTAFFLYLCLYSLFSRSPLGKTRLNPQSIALLATLMWAIHPIQVQSVTYIVQRMTSLAGFFYVLCLFSYVRFRLSFQMPARIQWASLVVFSFVAAVMSKENAVTLPLNIWVLEFVFFKGLNDKGIRKQFYISAILLLMVGTGLVTYVLMGNNLFGLLDNYDVRSFSPAQRVLTQPRVIAMYLGKIFFPVPSQYTIDHDLFHSSSLLVPWTTLPSIVFLMAFVILGFVSLRRFPWLGFGIFFFCIAHGVESSMLSLELVFEHRNYVPSMFLFPPIALGIARTLEKYRSRSRGGLVHIALVCFVPVMIVTLGLGTRARNFDWHSEISLWEDALKKAPKSARAHQNYALALYRHSQDPDIDHIVRMNLDAVKLLDHKNREYAETISFNNLSWLYWNQGEYKKALSYAQKAAVLNPESKVLQFRLARCFTDNEKFDAALETINKLTTVEPIVLDDLVLKAEILFRMGDMKGAEILAVDIMKKAPLSPIARKYKAFSNYLGGNYRGAEHYLKQWAFHGDDDESIFLRLLLAQVYHRMGKKDEFHRIIDDLIHDVPISRLKKILSQNERDKFPMIRLAHGVLNLAINNRLPL